MRYIAGALLVVFGIVFLANNLNFVRYDFGDFISDFWPLALIIVGASIIYQQMKSKSDDDEWNILEGKKFHRSVGDSKIKPSSIPPEGLKVSHGLGDANIDLSNTHLQPGENKVECTLGAGDLIVTLPANTPVKVSGNIGAGDLYLLGQHIDGIASKLEHTDDNYDTAVQKIRLRVKVGLGDAKVARA